MFFVLRDTSGRGTNYGYTEDCSNGVAFRQVVDADCPWDSSLNRGNRRIMAPLRNTLISSETDREAVARPERRQQPRHRVRDAQGTLGWHEENEEITVRMTVIDLSGAGAAVLADRGAPVGHPVWVRLDSGTVGCERMDARVVSTSAETTGMHIVRMQFTSWLPVGNVLEQHEEHRVWQRYPAREKRASLIWLDRGVEQTFPGELMNISGGGAAVITDAPVPALDPVWLTLSAGPDPITPVESRLVAVSIDASGLRVARLKFVEACPMGLFERVVHGAQGEK